MEYKSWLTLIFIIALFTIIAVKTDAKTVNVPDDYPTIQRAIDNAKDGDTILVSPGVYRENVVVNKRLNIIGEEPEKTIIDGGKNEDVIKITGSEITINGFTIRNSGKLKSTGYDSKLPSAGILIFGSSSIVVSSCKILNNEIGVWLISSSNTMIYNCHIYNNSKGAAMTTSPDNIISNCNISSNKEGINILDSSRNEILNCKISNNEFGIGYKNSSSDKISGCNIYSNNIGVYLLYTSNDTVSSCNVNSNKWYGIWLSSSSKTLIMDSSIYLNKGDGIELDYSYNNTVSYCSIYSNLKNGIYSYFSFNNSIHHNNIYGNFEFGAYNYNNETRYVINATNNWWGSSDGPSGVAPGSGDKVTANVIFEPWLTKKVNSKEGNKIPEFGTVVFIAALLAASLFIFKRKNKVNGP